MTDEMNFEVKHYQFYIEQWLDAGTWQKIIGSQKSAIIDIDQKRGKDGLFSKLNSGRFDFRSVIIDFNGITTFKGFLERFLSAYMHHPDMGLRSVSDMFVDAFMAYNPSVTLNAYSREAAVYFPDSRPEYAEIKEIFKNAISRINENWKVDVRYFINNADHIFDLKDDQLLSDLNDFFKFLRDNYQVYFIIEDAGEEGFLKQLIDNDKGTVIRAKLPAKESIISYFANFWNVKPASVSHQNLVSFLDLVDYDPLLAWHLNNAVYSKKIESRISFSMFREEVDLFLNINQNLYRNIFNALTNYQKRILKALAVTDGNKMTSKAVREKFELNTSPYVVQGLEFLSRKRLIRNYNKRHLFVDPLFRIWVLKYA